MAYQITSFSTSPFTNARIYSILCDTDSDLPATVDGYSVSQGWAAKTVDGKSYIANSSGTWVLQTSGIQLDLDGYYTSAETDSLLAGKQDSLTSAQIDALNTAACGSKNKLDYSLASLQSLNTAGTWSGNVYTRRGITYTVNSDLTIDVSGTNDGTGDSWLDLYGTGTTSDFIGMVCSGCPEGGSATTYGQQCGNANWDYGSTDGRICVQGPIALVVRSGYDASGGLTFKPMVCTAYDWSISKTYVPYCPSLYDLYQMVLSYHS